MSQSMLSLKRSTTSAVLQLNLYCGGTPPVPATAAETPTPHAKDEFCACADEAGARRCLWCRRAQPALVARLQSVADELDNDDEADSGDSGSDMDAEPAPVKAPRSLQLTPGAVDEAGGLPSPLPPGTPESDEGFSEPEAGAVSPVTDDLYHLTLDLVTDYYQMTPAALGPRACCYCGGGGGSQHDKALETLRRVGDGIVDKHKLAFQGMLRKLDIKHKEDIKCVSTVALSVFSDGVTNWGRITTLICFGAFVAKHLKSIHLENSINTLAQSITDFLMTHNRAWIVQHNGWEGCVEFFHVEDVEGGIRNVLMAFAGVAGLGASLAYMIR
ncbi:LOW QUALITY PROTEIN: induced myeloid leukemia cell differentiation protein Mcl-1 [Rhinatrema bivittatum]|uniref:LOW QUALITY PROTEIN: induced myeloid leukemia cell differentiation protein Mcl-1 n=1 Tax=Rhinatrema bivittatum TaxID=194408 RepID=UPI00112B2DBB|nr:LOW QUALITY PROTEIN: induced myeloid leukemia cell differentiation protein Mcl-1 [Rhinatrema bivittatum]